MHTGYNFIDFNEIRNFMHTGSNFICLIETYEVREVQNHQLPNLGLVHMEV